MIINALLRNGHEGYPDFEEEDQQTANDKPETEETEENISVDLNEFEVTRTEFFAHTRVPSFVFNNGKVGVNTACIRKLADVEYVQYLINRQKKKLAIRPCQEDDIFSIEWGKTKNGKRFPRQITGRMFFMKVCDMMEWDPQHKYKILGKLVPANNEIVFLFDLKDAEVFERSTDENGKMKSSRIPAFPAEWKNQFGIPFSEHKKALQINMFDGYTVFSIGDKKAEKNGASDAEVIKDDDETD